MFNGCLILSVRTSLCWAVLTCKCRHGWMTSNNRVSVSVLHKFLHYKLFMWAYKACRILDHRSDLFWPRDFDGFERHKITYFSTVCPPKCKTKVSNSVIDMPRSWRQFCLALAYWPLFAVVNALSRYLVCALWFILYIKPLYFILLDEYCFYSPWMVRRSDRTWQLATHHTSQPTKNLAKR